MLNDLIAARTMKTPVERPSRRHPDMTVEEAYTLQRHLVGRLISEQREVVVGYKISPKTVVEGSPWNALLWLVQALAEKGEALKPRQIVMTGGIAKFMDGLLGKYEATYECLGTIRFAVE